RSRAANPPGQDTGFRVLTQFLTIRSRTEHAMTRTLQPLKDKVALVVGGSRATGAAIVRRLAEDGAGIALTYAAAADKANELVQQIAAGGVRAIAIKADSGNEAELRDAVAKTRQQFGRLDILVVNAGVLIRG